MDRLRLTGESPAVQLFVAPRQRFGRDRLIDAADATTLGKLATDEESRKLLLELVNGFTVNTSGVEQDVTVTPPGASLLNIYARLPTPQGDEDRRNADFFSSRGLKFTGTHQSSKGIEIPNEMLYFNGRVGIFDGTLKNVEGVKAMLKGSGYSPVLATMPDGSVPRHGAGVVQRLRRQHLRTVQRGHLHHHRRP